MAYLKEREGYSCQECIDDWVVREYQLIKCNECHNWKAQEDFYQNPVGGISLESVCIDCIRKIFDIKKCSKCKKYKKSEYIYKVPFPPPFDMDSGMYDMQPDLICIDCLDDEDRIAMRKSKFKKTYLLIAFFSIVGIFSILKWSYNISNHIPSRTFAFIAVPIVILISILIESILHWIQKDFLE